MDNYFKDIVKYLQKRIGKIITSKEIESLQKEKIGSNLNKNKFYKLIYNLKNRGYLIELKNGLYTISYPEAQLSGSQYNRERHYWAILDDVIHKYCKSDYCISGTKGLEIYLNNYEIPDSIEILNSKVTKTETIVDKCQACFKNYKKTTEHVRGSSRLLIKQKRYKASISGHNFFVAPLELCILETLYYTSTSSSGQQIELIKKILKKAKYKIDMSIITMLIKAGKYHTSINRLYDLSKGLDNTLSEDISLIIKKNSFRLSL